MRNITFTLVLSGLFYSSQDRLQLVDSNIKYTDLPSEVKVHIFKGEFVDLNNPNKYSIESYQTLLPWVYESRLIRLKDNKAYQLDFDGEYDHLTFIIKDDYLYKTNNYNIYEHDSLKYTFAKYLID